jgi:hypothetical protein
MHEPRPAATAALAWLTHPVTCVALVLLIVNDHVLKAMWGTWWTGKLSDAAWLVVGPPLLATIMVGAGSFVGARRPSARSCTRVSLVVVGALFVVVKSTAVGAALASAALTALAGPSVVLGDPTDLLMLPALALAWVVARATLSRVRPEPGPRMRSTARWLMVLPLAVLATTATSQTPPTGAMQVAVVDNVLTVGDSSGPRSGGVNWYRSEDGSSWDHVFSWTDEAKKVAAEVAGAGGTVQSPCVPASPQQCFRVAEHGLGVDRSEDGGRTWRADWSVPDEVLAELADRYEPKGAQLRTMGVAIMPSPDGFRVYAANGGDGLAVRDESGTWQRLGFSYRTDGQPVVPLPGEPTRMAYPLPWSVILGVAAALATLALSARRSGHRRRSDPVLGGRIVALCAAVASGLAALANNAWGAIDGQQFASDVFLGSLLSVVVVGALTLLAAVLVIASADLLRGGRAAWLIVVTGVDVALVVELVPRLALAAVVAVAVLGAGVAAQRLMPAAPQPYG